MMEKTYICKIKNLGIFNYSLRDPRCCASIDLQQLHGEDAVAAREGGVNFSRRCGARSGQGRGGGYLPPAGGLVHLGGGGAPVPVPVLQDPAGLGQTLDVDPLEIWKHKVARHAVSTGTARPSLSLPLSRGRTNL